MLYRQIVNPSLRREFVFERNLYQPSADEPKLQTNYN